MAVLQMQRMNLVAMKQNRKAILERLQELGALEIDVPMEETEGIMREDTSGQKAEFEKQASLADQALEILDKYAPEKTSLFAALAGKPLVGRELYEDAAQNCASYLEKAEMIVHWEKEITEARAGILKLENQQEMLDPWKKLDIPMNTEGTGQTVLFLGTIGEAVTAETVLGALKSQEPSVEAADVEILESGKDGTWLTVLCLKQDAKAAEDALRGIGFARPSYLVDDVPVRAQEAMDRQIDALQEDIRLHSERIASLSGYRQKFQMVSDYCRLRAEKYEALGALPQTANTFAVSGYIPQYRAREVAGELEERFGAAVELEDIGEKEEAPVLLKNNRFSDSVEGILSSYGDRSYLFHVHLLRIFVWHDALRRRIRCDHCDRLRGGAFKIPADGRGPEENAEIVFLVRDFHRVLGNHVRKLFWRSDQCGIPQLDGTRGDGPGCVVRAAG